MQFWAIVIDGFRESRDRKIFWVMLGLSVIVAGSMACVGFHPGSIDFFFGAWTIQTDKFTSSLGLRTDIIATIIVDGIMDNTLGWFGIILAIIATAGFLPTFMERGAIDVVLAKPIPRWRLFLAKYLASMVFVLVQATFFVGLTLLVAGLRWGVWVVGYLYSIPLIVLLFSYLYCISAFVAVRYRSALPAVLLSIGAWIIFSGVQFLDDVLKLLPARTTISPESTSGSANSAFEFEVPQSVRTAVSVSRWLLPKTQDITYKARQLSRGAGAMELIPSDVNSDDEMKKRASDVEAARGALPLWQTVGSSLLFEAVVVMLTMWRFSRTDF